MNLNILTVETFTSKIESINLGKEGYRSVFRKLSELYPIEIQKVNPKCFTLTYMINIHLATFQLSKRKLSAPRKPLGRIFHLC
jgi:hypothetical protein